MEEPPLPDHLRGSVLVATREGTFCVLLEGQDRSVLGRQRGFDHPDIGPRARAEHDRGQRRAGARRPPHLACGAGACQEPCAATAADRWGLHV